MEPQLAELLARADTMPLTTTEEVEAYKRTFIYKKSDFGTLMDAFRALHKEDKARFGKPLNELKTKAETRLAEAEAALKTSTRTTGEVPGFLTDPTLPAAGAFAGSRHILKIVEQKIVNIFRSVAFVCSEGPEIEDDFHNFTALNFEADHPAREMQDTFFVRNPEVLLRTHTSTVQVRTMEKFQPPIRILSSGRVYRNEAVTARAHCFFHQIEGLYVDENVSVQDLRQTLLHFVRQLFGPDVKIRLRPSYFPFTEISAEMDVSCFICSQKGCNVCKHTGWVEILGCGMVDPNVLRNCGINPEKYSGFAFGMGIERIAMLLHTVPDLRLFSQSDVRFLSQFAGL